jgi:hypothetical protein
MLFGSGARVGSGADPDVSLYALGVHPSYPDRLKSHLGLVLLLDVADGGRSVDGSGLGLGLRALGSDLEVGAVELWVSDESG